MASQTRHDMSRWFQGVKLCHCGLVQPRRAQAVRSQLALSERWVGAQVWSVRPLRVLSAVSSSCAAEWRWGGEVPCTAAIENVEV